jgi:hypothetical protein
MTSACELTQIDVFAHLPSQSHKLQQMASSRINQKASTNLHPALGEVAAPAVAKKTAHKHENHGATRWK